MDYLFYVLKAYAVYVSLLSHILLQNAPLPSPIAPLSILFDATIGWSQDRLQLVKVGLGWSGLRISNYSMNDCSLVGVLL